MNVENLRKLKDITSELSVLFVEDSQVLQKQVGQFLSKIFKDVYQAYDGQDGILKYKKYKPDIILTDITMPKKDGLDMIREIKIINNDVKIIVISAHNDESVIEKIIGLKVLDFLLKPLDIDKLIEKLLDVYVSSKKESKKLCFQSLEMLHQHNGKVGFINYYKKIAIENDGKIMDIVDGQICIKTDHLQVLAIEHEQYIIIELKNINKFIKLKLSKVDKENDLVYLINPMYINHTRAINNNKHYFLDNKTKIGLHINHSYYEFDIIEISSELVVMYCAESDIELNDEDIINFTIFLDLDESSNKMYATKIFSKGSVQKIGSFNGGMKIVSTVLIEDEDKILFKNYLHKIEDTIIFELTQ